MKHTSRDTIATVGAGLDPARIHNPHDPSCEPPRTTSVTPRLPSRCSLRLHHYDYSRPGAYFITISTHRRFCLFGEVRDGSMSFNPLGRIAHNTWLEIPGRFARVRVDLFVVMPNHLHGILMLEDASETHVRNGHARKQGSTPASVPSIIGSFKSIAALRAIETGLWTDRTHKLWQRNYYEHVIRNEHSLQSVREYIANNPAQWSLDRENPCRLPSVASTESTVTWMV